MTSTTQKSIQQENPSLTLHFQGQIVSREWEAIVMERKGRESIGCPSVKHNHYVI